MRWIAEVLSFRTHFESSTSDSDMVDGKFGNLHSLWSHGPLLGARQIYMHPCAFGFEYDSLSFETPGQNLKIWTWNPGATNERF